MGKEKPILYGYRGYNCKKNQINIYDDVLILEFGNSSTHFKANTDPSILRERVAVLQPGVYFYKLGTHGLNKPKEKQYQALVQAAPVTIARHMGKVESGYFGLNIHRGSRTTTSSEGCQTLHPDCWEAFIALVKRALKESGETTIKYILADETFRET